ncbi:MAG: hypothetical protein IKF62_00350, partial [Bosea sp.]|nr:hypothetical protein [Bosea sp. (in: a-proteobacteria)]
GGRHRRGHAGRQRGEPPRQRSHQGRCDGDVQAQFGWFCTPDVPISCDQLLPLAAQPEPCKLRLMAVEALEAAGIAWCEAFTGEGAAAVDAAAMAGLGVALLARQGRRRAGARSAQASHSPPCLAGRSSCI